VSGSIAAAAVTLVVAVAGRRAAGSSAAPLNATSHFLWGGRAGREVIAAGASLYVVGRVGYCPRMKGTDLPAGLLIDVARMLAGVASGRRTRTVARESRR